MGITTYSELMEHRNHRLVLATYGDEAHLANLAIECEDCHIVLRDWENDGSHEFKRMTGHLICGPKQLGFLQVGDPRHTAQVLCACNRPLLSMHAVTVEKKHGKMECVAAPPDTEVKFVDCDPEPPDVGKAMELILGGLTIDGAHHKQWYLEEIAKALGQSPSKLRKKGHKWKKGVKG